MGQKVHPYILRIGFGKDWQSKWFSDRKRDYAQFLDEDLKARKIVKDFYTLGSIASISVERASPTLLRLQIRTSRPGVIIGRRGQDIERLKSKLTAAIKKEVMIDVVEVSDPSVEAQLVAELIAFQMIKRVNFRRAMKKAIQQAVSLGCEGLKVRSSGRLGGVEIARSEKYKYGKVPLHTFRADIDYGFSVAKTTYGTIGVKAWIYKGQKMLGSYLAKDTQEEK